MGFGSYKMHKLGLHVAYESSFISSTWELKILFKNLVTLCRLYTLYVKVTKQTSKFGLLLIPVHKDLWYRLSVNIFYCGLHWLTYASPWAPLKPWRVQRALVAAVYEFVNLSGVTADSFPPSEVSPQKEPTSQKFPPKESAIVNSFSHRLILTL